MIPSSLELNSDDFPFFGDLKRTSGSREKLEKSSFENRDNHHRPRPRESRRWWWWWWWLEKIRKTKIQKKTQRHKDKYTHTNTEKYQIHNHKKIRMQKVKCHAAMLNFFFSQVTTWLFAIILTLTEVEISCRTYNSGAVNYHFFATIELEFLTVELDFLPLNLSF